jgi:phosphohistidine phosphatase
MKILYLTRHAHQEVSSVVVDHDRNLTEEGIAYCKKLASFLQRNNDIPQFIISSSANRAKQTTLYIADGLSISKEDIHFTRALYSVSTKHILSELHNLDDKYSVVMLVNHNPSISALLADLAKSSNDVNLAQDASAGMQPGNTAKFIFNVEEWHEISKETSIMKWLYR